MAFRVLGPLEIVVDDHQVPVSAPKLRTVLASLLLQANHTVPLDELIEKLWDEGEPRNARSTVQKYIMRTRRILDSTGLPDDVLRTELDGYRLTVSPEQIDLSRFIELRSDWEEAARAGDATREASRLTEALRLWRAVPPLANVPSVSLHRHEVTGLVERYLHALDRRIELDLGRGMHAELVSELAQLTSRYPHQERLWAHRMRALNGCGRQSDALAVYRDVVALLADEVGVDPGSELQAAHREILANPPPETLPASRERRPHQLPRSPVGFVSREAELTRISEGLGEAPVVITGMAGSGKTALAICSAYQLAHRFPDGQLYADLRGSAGLGDVLEQFVLSLGAAPGTVPVGEDAQIMLYRSLLARQRMLVVLDDVADADQVRALMPGTPSCAVLVTSRDELAGLLVSPGVCRVRLGELTPAQSFRLLARLLGPRRVAADRTATARLVDICAGLPLALRIAAVHLLQHPELRMADYVALLHAEGPAAALHIRGDKAASTAAAFDRSYDTLRPDHRRFLQTISRLPATHLRVSTAAEQAGVSEAEASSMLETLASINLIRRLPARRYQMLGLLRSYVRHRESGQTAPRVEAEQPSNQGEVPYESRQLTP